MGWESFNVIGFDLGPLLQGQTRLAKVQSVYGRASGSAGSAFCFPYNSVIVRRILFKFGRFRQ